MRKEIENSLRDERGYARVFKYEVFDGQECLVGVGMVDENNNEVLPCIYDNIIGFRYGSPLAIVERDGLYGYFDAKLNQVTPFWYESADEKFCCGRALVKRNGKFGFIDIFGKETIPCEYDGAYSFWDYLACVEKDGFWGIINIDGEAVVPCTYGYLCVLGNGRILIKSRGKYGLLDYVGKTVVPCIYDRLAYDKGKNLIEYTYSDERGYLDLNGGKKAMSPFARCPLCGGQVETKVELVEPERKKELKKLQKKMIELEEVIKEGKETIEKCNRIQSVADKILQISAEVGASTIGLPPEIGGGAAELLSDLMKVEPVVDEREPERQRFIQYLQKEIDSMPDSSLTRACCSECGYVIKEE